MKVYADTSFFVALYLVDGHATNAQHRLNAEDARVWLTPFHVAEIASAIGQQVFRGKASAHEAKSVLETFEFDRSAGIWVQTPVPDSAFEACATLARRHTAQLGTRTLETLHVAMALELRAEQFWTFDARQAQLAKAEGLADSF